MHHFHIPVMGIAYTLETPIKVAHYGINSVMSVADHQLMEQIRKYYCALKGFYYTPIPEAHEEDSRACSITAYLDQVHTIVQDNFTKLKQSLFQKGSEITKYFEMLPRDTPLKQAYNYMLGLSGGEKSEQQEILRQQIKPGSLDVNIMTKLDKVNYATDGSPLPAEYNDAHAALRGFAKSQLNGAVVFSAGINPRLYTYITQFGDFFPDTAGNMKKRIIIKVSDYKSALVQGKFLAKKGLWVSEFRIESGLNCGGHAFATDGHLLGPILQEFKDKRQELFDMLYSGYHQALEQKGYNVPAKDALPFGLSVQGGIGTHEEQAFLRQTYGVDSVGWGSPFLLVPEAVTIDRPSLNLLAQSKQEDLYLSNISPLGVPFNSVRNTTEEQVRQERIAQNKPGSPCNKKYLVSNKEFTDEPVCTASKAYQKRKLKAIEAAEYESEAHRQKDYDKTLEKTCICNGLTNPALFEKGMKPSLKNSGISICPGPNMAYFNREVSLQTMVSHINGYTNIMEDHERPDLFSKELEQYIKYFKNLYEEWKANPTDKAWAYLKTFSDNLNEGIEYYKKLFSKPVDVTLLKSSYIFNHIEGYKRQLEV